MPKNIEIDLSKECENHDEDYKGCPWFFENSQREEASKEDSFINVNFENVYEMEGVVPQDDTSHFIDEQETRPG
jgi:hypothetical protein